MANKTFKQYLNETLIGSYDYLEGLKVIDTLNDEALVIKSVDGASLWCGKNPNDDFGHYFSISDAKARFEVNGEPGINE